MAIEKIHIKNFKSLVNVIIDKPNPFTVFVGPNASGKSNIFEALEMYSFIKRFGIVEAFSSLYDKESIVNFNKTSDIFKIQMNFDDYKTCFSANNDLSNPEIVGITPKYGIQQHFPLNEIPFFDVFQKLFINNKEKVKIVTKGENRLSADASNLEKVLKRLLVEPDIKDEFVELISFFIPEFKNVEIKSDELSGNDSLLIYERYTNKPFSRHLISDGTFNIIALLTSVYQSYFEGSFYRQFLCIEEPENGIHPEAIKELVGFFREQCEEKGHYIWLTTHSQSLVAELKPEEIIVVDKIEGETRIKQFQGEEFYSLSMDDAWLSNVLGGGLL